MGPLVSIATSLRSRFANTKSEKIEKLIYKVENIANPYEFSMTAGYLLGLSNASRKELTVEQLNQGVFQIDAYSKEEKATIDVGTARIQEILEAKSPESAVRKIEVLLG